MFVTLINVSVGFTYNLLIKDSKIGLKRTVETPSKQVVFKDVCTIYEKQTEKQTTNFLQVHIRYHHRRHGGSCGV